MGFLRTWSGVALLAMCLLPVTANADTYKHYGQLLDEYVIEKTLPDDGLVSAFDYTAALKDEATKRRLAEQRKALTDFDTSTLTGQQAAVAFWINAYNFFMLDQILTERPDGKLVSSVWDYGGRVNPFVDSVFDREIFEIDGQMYSLNQIEKGILLGEDYQSRGWKDARVHFAVNCASVGCPPLRKQVYTAENLESLLAENTRRAFSTPYHLTISGDTLKVTELFKWYEDDFVEAAGSERAYIQKWASEAVAEKVSGTSDMGFIDYDWSLNRPEHFPDISQ